MSQPAVGCVRCRDIEPPPPRCLGCGLTRSDRAAAAARPAGGTSIRDLPAERSPFDLGEARHQQRLLLLAPPIAIGLAFLMMASPMARMLSRIFLSMWIHELGHAVTAWLAGFGAFPGPWRTMLSDGRLPLLSVAIAAGLGLSVWHTWRTGRHRVAIALAAVILIQAIFTLGLSASRAQMLITFGGDGGMLVLGTVLAASFFAPPGSYIHTHWLRWGFLVIGAFAFADAAATWWSARTDLDAIPFGEIEGVGLSDPTKLVETYGWTTRHLVDRYVALTASCAVAFTALWAHRVWRGRRDI